MNVFQAGNAVIVSYTAFSGGKFLGNCLALSQYACPQEPSAARYLLRKPDDYDFRLETVLKTLPPSEKMLDWRRYEFGDLQLYGPAWEAWRTGLPKPPNRLTQDICHSGMRFFFTDHSFQPINLCGVWSNATILRMINSRKFQKLALQKKNPHEISDITEIAGNYCEEKYNFLRGDSWPEWQAFEQAGYDSGRVANLDLNVVNEINKFYPMHVIKNPVILFDVDSNYYNRDRFMSSMADLYQLLGLLDYQPTLVSKFYDSYMALHIGVDA